MATMHQPAAELDELTLRRAQRGDQDACRELVRRYQRPVFALLHRLLGSAHTDKVEDVAQETFLQVFRAIASFAPLGPAKLSSWILTIASRKAIDELRRRDASSESVEVGETLASSKSADEHTRRRLIGRAIQRAVGELSPEYRAAFLLREYHSMDYAEIARALDIDLGTVKSRLARARAALRISLEEIRDE